MNNPFVKKLYYKMIIKKDVDYDKASPVVISNDHFDLNADINEVCFTMKSHFSTEEEARKITDEFLKNWEIIIGLENAPDDITFKYMHVDIIDLEPDQQEKYVNLKDGSAEDDIQKHFVKTGMTDENNIEIVEGLKEGDVVIIKTKKIIDFGQGSGGRNPFRPQFKKKKK